MRQQAPPPVRQDPRDEPNQGPRPRRPSAGARREAGALCYSGQLARVAGAPRWPPAPRPGGEERRPTTAGPPLARDSQTGPPCRLARCLG